MPHPRFLRIVLILMVLALPRGTPLVAQPFVLDDAGIVGVGACQLEAFWVSQESEILPACALWLPIEITPGFSWGPEKGEFRHLFGVKFLLRDPDQFRLGLSLVAGGHRDSDRSNGEDAMHAYFPITLTIERNDRPLLLHVNVGQAWSRPFDPGASLGGWERSSLLGIRADWPLTSGILGILEFLHNSPSGWESRWGLRVTVIEERLALDWVWGLLLNSAEDRISLGAGFAWTPKGFLSFTPDFSSRRLP